MVAKTVVERKSDITTVSVRNLIEAKNPNKKVLEAKYLTMHNHFDIKIYEFTYLYKEEDICRDILLTSPDRNLYCVCSDEVLAGIALRYILDFNINFKECNNLEYYKYLYTCKKIDFYAKSKYGISDTRKFDDLYPYGWLENNAFLPLCVEFKGV
jgi:hypothetical protein